MIAVPGEAAIGPEGEHDMRANGSYPVYELSDDVIQVCAEKLAVGIAQNLAVSDTKELAGRVELPDSEGGKLFVGAGGAAISGSGASGETDYGNFYSALGIEGEGATEGSSFVIRMGGDAKKSVHDRIESNAGLYRRSRNPSVVAPSPSPAH